MAHSNERREFVLTEQGLAMIDAAGESRGTPDAAGDGARKGRSRHAVI